MSRRLLKVYPNAAAAAPSDIGFFIREEERRPGSFQ